MTHSISDATTFVFSPIHRRPLCFHDDSMELDEDSNSKEQQVFVPKESVFHTIQLKMKWLDPEYDKKLALKACEQLQILHKKYNLDLTVLDGDIRKIFESESYYKFVELDWFDLMTYFYQKTDFCYIMNNKLDTMTSEEDIEGLECTIQLMEWAITHHEGDFQKLTDTCFRAMSVKFEGQLKIGNVFVARRFLSCTQNLRTALGFLEISSDYSATPRIYEGILMVIRSRHGRAQKCIFDRFCGEAEVIFLPNTVLQVWAILTGTDASDYIGQFEYVKKSGRNFNFTNLTVIVCQETTPET